ncbi:MAG: putative rane protein [Patescibacteria group bacterium]|nr:putative rane protein [Patescibacteria group bacterium]
MTRLIAKLIIVAGGLLLIARFVPGIEITSFYIALIVAVLWGVVSVTLRPLLFLFTLPINIVTLGLFSFVLNALLFWFLATFIAGFHVEGFVAALIGSFLLTFTSWISDIALKSK